MTSVATGSGAQPRRRGQSAIAFVTGLVVGVGLTLGTDQILHVLGVYPPWGQSMSDGLFMVATGYRIIYSILGSYLAARLAPNRPMWHAMVLGIVGFVVSIAGAAATWNRQPPLGPHWYPIAVALVALPCAWIGGKLVESRRR